MSRTDFETLLKAGCHFGHLKRKWNPAMAPYIFMERNGIHIIDLNKTVAMVDTAAEALKQIAKSGKRILFVATKKQAKDIVAEKAKALREAEEARAAAMKAAEEARKEAEEAERLSEEDDSEKEESLSSEDVETGDEKI